MEYRNVNKIDARRSPIRQLLLEGSTTNRAVAAPEIKTTRVLNAARSRNTGALRVGYGRGRPEYSGSDFNAQQLASQRAIEMEARRRGLS